MTDEHSSVPRAEGSSFWRGLRTFLFGSDGETTLRGEIEEAIDNHEGEAPKLGDLSPVERQMLRNLLHFGERTVGEVALPRGDIIAVPSTIGFDDLVAAFVDAEHSRLPVYEDSLDSVIGMVHIKDVFRLKMSDAVPPSDLSELLRAPLFVPESMGVLDLLARMRAERVHLAIVVDEFGGTEGLVSIEDIVEEIVGDIEDEHDEAAPGMLIPLDHGLWDADARTELDEVAQTVDARLAVVEEDVDTLGGLAFVLAGHVPEQGEFVEHPSQQVAEALDIGIVERGIDFVEHADRRRIGQEKGEDQRHRRKSLFAARKQGQGRQAFARRLGHDLQPGFQWVVRFDELQMGLATVEQCGEKAAEMTIDRLEGGQEPRPPFPVQAADGSAKAVDGEPQFLAFALAVGSSFLQFGKFAFGNEIDRPDPLAVEIEAFERRRFDAGLAHRIRVETGLFGKERRRAFEPLSGNTGHFHPAGFLILVARDRARPGFTRRRQGLPGLGQMRFEGAQFGLSLALVSRGALRRSDRFGTFLFGPCNLFG